jgi:catechol 2,3-dioxygenase-like lactoylglutathione lyase family enzyme
MTDYARSRAFYEDKLGFRVDWEHRFEPGFPVFAQVSRNGMAIYLSEHTGDCEVGGLVHFVGPDVDGWHEEFVRNRTAIKEAPNEGIEGLRMMTVVDPDGNQLRFFTRLKDRDPADGAEA